MSFVTPPADFSNSANFVCSAQSSPSDASKFKNMLEEDLQKLYSIYENKYRQLYDTHITMLLTKNKLDRSINPGSNGQEKCDSIKLAFTKVGFNYVKAQATYHLYLQVHKDRMLVEFLNYLGNQEDKEFCEAILKNYEWARLILKEQFPKYPVRLDFWNKDGSGTIVSKLSEKETFDVPSEIMDGCLRLIARIERDDIMQFIYEWMYLKQHYPEALQEVRVFTCSKHRLDSCKRPASFMLEYLQRRLELFQRCEDLHEKRWTLDI